MHLPHSPSSLLLPLLLLGLAGCASDLPQLQQASKSATATLAQAQAEDAALTQQATTRPAADPLHAQVTQLESIITQVQALLPTINSAIASISSGSAVDPAVQQALGALPYGSIALAVASLVFALVKHVQASNLTAQQRQTQSAFQQLLAAINTPTPAPQSGAAAPTPNPTPQPSA